MLEIAGLGAAAGEQAQARDEAAQALRGVDGSRPSMFHASAGT
jgi:hypothetical protein